MSVEHAARRTVAIEWELVQAAAAGVPKAWGALAARGVLAFRELAGRAPTDAERRAIWDALWEGVERARTATACGTCGRATDPARHAICVVCGGQRLCLSCARSHLCTSECRERGCVAGLCVKEVRDGSVAETFGIP